MPSFYENGGVMLTPEAIAMRQATAKGEEVVVTTKKDIVDDIVRLNGNLGVTTPASQIAKYNLMRKDQLEEIHAGVMAKQPTKSTVTLTE